MPRAFSGSSGRFDRPGTPRRSGCLLVIVVVIIAIAAGLALVVLR